MLNMLWVSCSYLWETRAVWDLGRMVPAHCSPRLWEELHEDNAFLFTCFKVQFLLGAKGAGRESPWCRLPICDGNDLKFLIGGKHPPPWYPAELRPRSVKLDHTGCPSSSQTWGSSLIAQGSSLFPSRGVFKTWKWSEKNSSLVFSCLLSLWRSQKTPLQIFKSRPCLHPEMAPQSLSEMLYNLEMEEMRAGWSGVGGEVESVRSSPDCGISSESSKQRVLREWTWSLRPQSRSSLCSLCISERGVGRWGGSKDKRPVAGCHITKLRGRSEESKSSHKKDQRKLWLCNMPTADRQAALALHLS